MQTVVQYPDTITIKVIGPTTEDAMGNPIPGEVTYRDHKCRAEAPNVKTDPIKNNDGESLDFSWMVYAPFGVPRIADGTEVTLADRGGQPFYTGTVKRFSPGQMNTRIWL